MLTTIIVFILVLGLLVFVHEFGHFMAARLSGMKVHEFALGFPPLVIGCYKDPKTGKLVWVNPKSDKAKRKALQAGSGNETDEPYPTTFYSLNLLPIGGYCRIKGENGESVEEKDSFGYQTSLKKMFVVVAGVVMNFILAAVLLGVGFLIGLPTLVSDGVPEGANVGEIEVIVQEVIDGSAASEAGLEAGDKLISVNGEAVETSNAAVAFIAEHSNSELSVLVERDEEELTIAATPKIIEGVEGAKLGVRLGDAALVSYPWYLAAWKGLQAAFWNLIGIFVGFFLLIKGLILGNGLAFEVSGPVGIASIVGDSARQGINYLIGVTAMISLSLAAINILPIPALDGGRFVFILVEAVTGKKVPKRYEQMAHSIGFVLLLGLILVVTFRDITNLFS